MENRIGKDVSLLDLFITLLVYRKFLFSIITFVFIIIMGVYFLYQPPENKDISYFKAHLTMGYVISPKALGIEYDITAMLKDPQLILDSLLETGYQTYNLGTSVVNISQEPLPDSILRTINQHFTEGNSQIPPAFEIKETKNKNIEVYLSDHDTKRLQALALTFLKNANIKIQEHMVTQAKHIINTHNRLLKKETATSGEKILITEGAYQYILSQRLISEKIAPLTLLQSSTISKKLPPQKNKKRFYLKLSLLFGIVTILGAIGLVFILTAIEIIKTDEQSMERIKAAWNN